MAAQSMKGNRSGQSHQLRGRWSIAPVRKCTSESHDRADAIMGPTSRRWRAALQLISTQRATGDAEELVGERDQVVQHPGPGVLLVQVVVRRLLVCDFRLRGSLGARRSRRRRPCSSHCEMPTCRVDGAAIIERFLQPLERPTGLRARARVRREEPAQSGRRRATPSHQQAPRPRAADGAFARFHTPPQRSLPVPSSACK